MSKLHRTDPSRQAKCVLLSDGDHTAGQLLNSICYWSKYASVKIPKAEGVWIANPRPWWARETAMSLRQFDRSISKLQKMGLIEKRQFWYAHVNMLHVRPLPVVLDFLEAASTWSAVYDLRKDFPYAASASVDIADFGNPTSLSSGNSIGLTEFGNQGLPEQDNSNVIILQNEKLHEKQTGSLTCAKDHQDQKEIQQKDKSEIPFTTNVTHLLPQQSLVTPSILVNFWARAIENSLLKTDAVANVNKSLTAKDVGELLNYCDRFPIDEDQMLPIRVISYVIENWKQFIGSVWPGKYFPSNHLAYIPSVKIFVQNDGFQFWASCSSNKNLEVSLVDISPVFDYSKLAKLPFYSSKAQNSHHSKYDISGEAINHVIAIESKNEVPKKKFKTL